MKDTRVFGIGHYDWEKNMFDWLKRRRHQNSGASPPLPPCKHVWKDFPWYIEDTYYTDTKINILIIYEPYVCVHCKERKNVVLYRNESHCSSKEADELIKECEKMHKDYIKNSAIVEDMINDFIYVDREKLELLENLYKISKEKENG